MIGGSWSSVSAAIPRSDEGAPNLPEEHREFDPLVDRAPSRYVVGIDLGTTNSAMAYVDTPRAGEGTRVSVDLGRQSVDATIVGLPFYKSS